MRPILLSLTLLLAFAACGGDGGTTPPDPEPTFRNPPENAPRELTLGVPVESETITSATDADEFAFTAPASGVVAVVVRAQAPGQFIAISVVDSATNEPVALGTAEANLQIDAVVTADVGPGRWIVRLRASQGTGGGYALTVHAVNPHPEGVDSVLAPGAWATGEMSPFYDVDDFVFEGVAGQRVNLFAHNLDNPGSRLGVRLYGPGPVRGAPVVERFVEFWVPASTGVLTLPATGRYRVRVTGAPALQGAPHPYRVLVYPVLNAPEEVSSVLVDGQPVREPLAMPGDVDEYTFTASEGELLRLNFAVANAAMPAVEVEMRDAATGERVNVRFTRFQAPRTGTYRVTVSRPGWYFPDPEPHDYEIGLVRIVTAPERVPAAIALGDTVAEALDPAGDIDEYTLSGTAGTEVVILAEAPAYASVDLHRADTGERLARVRSWRTEPGLGRHASPRFRLPVTGQYQVRVWHDEDASAQRGPGAAQAADAISPAYRFSVQTISRAPESRPAAFAVGDTITGTLSPKHDVDIFTFSAQAGDRLVLWGARLGTAPPQEPLTFFVTRADQPEAIAWVFTNFGGPQPYAFTAPATGPYRVVVWPANAAGLQAETAEEGEYEGGYRFGVRRAAP